MALGIRLIYCSNPKRDVKNPLPESIDLLEDIVIEYITEMVKIVIKDCKGVVDKESTRSIEEKRQITDRGLGISHTKGSQEVQSSKGALVDA